LCFVMGIFEAKRICSLSRRLQFYEANEGFVNCDRVVGARLQVVLRGLADRDDSVAEVESAAASWSNCSNGPRN
jgi:hypothetical protein